MRVKISGITYIEVIRSTLCIRANKIYAYNGSLYASGSALRIEPGGRCWLV